MAHEITMPRLSDSMEEGTVLQWLVAEGDRVEPGQPLVEIETDKATVTHEADAAGVVLALTVGEGATVPLGVPIAVIGEEGELDVDLEQLPGSGPNGRVIRADVESSSAGTASDHSSKPAVPTASEAGGGAANGPPVGHAKGEVAVHDLNRVQQRVARRMAESRATVPDFELRSEVDLSSVVELRNRMREVTDPLPSYNDFIVKAAALALREFPRVNGSYRDGSVETYSRINVGVAVAADDALVVPTIFDADRLSLGEISRKSRELAARVGDGSIGPADLGGGTFTVSNLGMYGVDSFSAVVNPPQASILAVGSLKHRAIVDEAGDVVARPTVVLTLACDHRVLYGADGARFLSRIRELLERPDARML